MVEFGCYANPNAHHDKYISKRVASILDKMGFANRMVKSDQAHAIKDVAEDTRRKLCEELMRCKARVKLDDRCKGMVIESQAGMENSFVGDSHANRW